jgi:hypothetical protein
MLTENWRRRPLAEAFLLMASAAGGCMSQPEPVDTLPRVAVSGNVTVDGNPLPAGKIQFQPIGTEPAAMAVGEIQDGRFSIAQSVGPSPGKYRVTISSRTAPKIGEDQEPGGAPKLEPEKIPKRYNTQSKLEVDIAPEGPVTLDFPLDKKP